MMTNFPADVANSVIPPSDITPGIPRIAVDRLWALREIEKLQAKLNDLRPIVVRIGGLFHLYHGATITVQTPNAQMMIDYLDKTFPAGTKIRWFVLPVQPPLQSA